MCQLASLDDTACEVAEARHNARLNRYFNVLPFDYNRVQLSVRLSPPPRPAAQLPRCQSGDWLPDLMALQGSNWLAHVPDSWKVSDSWIMGAADW